MNKNNVYILEERGILYINGQDTDAFLQNLISNDIRKVNTNLNAEPLKKLFEFFVYRRKGTRIKIC